jgi:hypothetical protein
MIVIGAGGATLAVLAAVLVLLPVAAALPVATSATAAIRRLSERSPQVVGLGEATVAGIESTEAAPVAAAVGLATPVRAPTPSVPEPMVQQVPAEPMVQQVPAEPTVQQVPAEPTVQQVTPEPTVQQVTPEPVVQQVTPEPMVQQVTPEPVVQQVTPEPVVQQMAEPMVQQMAVEGLATPVQPPTPSAAVPVTALGEASPQPMPAAKRAAVAQLTEGLVSEPATPAVQPGTPASLPMGTYAQSCQECVFDNPVLRCARCEDGSRGCRNGDFSSCAGGAREVQVDLTGCSGGVVENDHGRLVCSKSSAASRGLGAPVGDGGGGHRMGSDLTYSQNFQDTWVVRLAAANGWVGKPGYFLDLGAFNGVYCSNSKLLEDILGWDGASVVRKLCSQGKLAQTIFLSLAGASLQYRWLTDDCVVR